MASTGFPSTAPQQPTTAAVAIGSAIIAGVLGYFLGQGSSLGLFNSPRPLPRQSQRSHSSSAKSERFTKSSSDAASKDSGGAKVESKDGVTVSASSDSESDSGSDVDYNHNGWEIQDTSEDDRECKLVLVVRSDLGMTKGKIAAQASHATLACYRYLLALSQSSGPSSTTSQQILDRWLRYGQAKVAVQVKSEDELETLQAQAMSVGVCAQTVRDAGRTQIAAGSITVLGVGPAGKSRVDAVTGGLRLL